MLVFSLVAACNSQSSGKRKKSTQNETVTKEAGDPNFSDSLSYIQIGNTNFKSSVAITSNYSDYVQLRGRYVHNYIKINNPTNPICIVTRFNHTGTNQFLVTAALTRNDVKTSNSTIEYYYSIGVNSEEQNKTFCQKSAIINYINSLFAGTNSIHYSLSSLCVSSTCTYSTYSSQKMTPVSQQGETLTNFSLDQLYFQVKTQTTETPAPSLRTCTSNSYCATINYDCCSSGICVKDLSVKDSTDTNSINYQQALANIIQNPAAIYNYPEFYNICSQPVVTPPVTTDPNDTASDAEKAKIRLEKLSALFTCSNPVYGEMGICESRIDVAEVGKTYTVSPDDTNFRSTLSNIHISIDALTSVEEIVLGGVTVYKASSFDLTQAQGNSYSDYANVLDPSSRHITVTNFNQDDMEIAAASVLIHKFPTNATSKNLIIRYRNNASCEKINSNLAKCEKYYYQDENALDNSPTSLLYNKTAEQRNQSTVTNHFPNSNIFYLPNNVDTNRAVTVTLDGITLKSGTQWTLVSGSPTYIEVVTSNGNQVNRGQKLKVSYFVNMTSTSNFMKSKLNSLSEINQKCGCSGTTQCNLAPIKNASGLVTDYTCVYPQTPGDAPDIQQAYLSSKSVPVRFFDQAGQGFSNISSSSYPQEGNEFSYRNNDLRNPVNAPDISGNGSQNLTDYYIGFNEIYGSLTKKTDSAKPPLQLNVKKGTSYDIKISNGTISNCLQCGTDYYSTLSRMFPLTNFGSGLVPQLGRTNRIATTADDIRSDDLKFGRACVLPATMIPWSHLVSSDVQSQRTSRMMTQHFLYANGYQFDWYGFDYGSVIGSFDGVKWFSIGTNRRIVAESNRLYIAINAPMGDQTVESTFKVDMMASSLNPFETNIVTSDYNSDGAQCQQYYQCSNDQDCATTLGWEYSCANVSEINTSWPLFDENGNEIGDSRKEETRLSAILGVTTNTKRCVYRGRGALCGKDPFTSSTNNYASSTKSNILSCAPGLYCQDFYSNGAPNPKFNNRIVRKAKVYNQAGFDTFGLAAKVTNRPYAFNATETPNLTALNTLLLGNAQGMCVPGQNVDAPTFAQQNSDSPIDPDHYGDKVLGIGITQTIDYGLDDQALSACSVFDSSRNLHKNTEGMTPDGIKFDAGTQNISTNSLRIFKDILSSKGTDLSVLKVNDTPLTNVALTNNRCMRAPGAACFSDLDCAPSKVITDKLTSIISSDPLLSGVLNKYEINFWKEDLVCSQKYPASNTNYDPRNNRCCRAPGKIIQLAMGDVTNQITYTKVAGIDLPYISNLRYSRSATLYNKVNSTDIVNNPPLADLQVPIKDQCTSPSNCFNAVTGRLSEQFNPLSQMASVTSCSEHWIRNFATGGHTWAVSKFQTISASTFRCYNWAPKSTITGPYEPVDDGSYSCANYGDNSPYCPIIQTTPSSYKAQEILKYFGKLELMGIPQITFDTEEKFINAKNEYLTCNSNPAGRDPVTYPYPPDTPNVYKVPQGIFNTTISAKEATDGVNQLYYSAVDPSNFSNTMKNIFKADEFTTCRPAGTQMDSISDANLCCTGYINSANKKCQLPDYIDLSVYTNRFVSSEAQGLTAGYFDESGFVKNTDHLAVLACEKSMCASGKMATGVLISNLKIPGATSNDQKIMKFLENATEDNANGILDLYKNGLKYNNHLYCIPEAVANSTNSNNDLTIYSCDN